MASSHNENHVIPSGTLNESSTATASTKPTLAADAVLKPSEPIPSTATQIRGLDFDAFGDRGPSIADLLTSMATTGFQASAVAEAARIINGMIDWQEETSTSEPSTHTASNPTPRKATIFLGYTSNLISSGLREVLRWLVQHRHVDAIVTTAGGVEEDLIKCLAPTYMGNFAADGATLRDKGINRIGNLFVPNDNYCKFEDWVVPILDRLLAEQETKRREQRLERWRKWKLKRHQQPKPSQVNGQAGVASEDEYEQFERESATDEDFVAPFTWTPSAIIARLGQEVNDERSVAYWAWKNDIPIFCPALTDGSLGDMLFFHSYKAAPRQLTVDICADIRRINDLAMRAAHAGIIILGGGIVKHHIANACLMRNGADKAVYINTAQEYDGSDAGARPDEAVSWGKIKAGGETVKVYAEATVVFPLLVAATFAKGKGKGK